MHTYHLFQLLKTDVRDNNITYQYCSRVYFIQHEHISVELKANAVTLTCVIFNFSMLHL